MAKKTKRGRLPKDVLGVKVPRELRKAGEKLIEQAQGPAGRQAIAGALTAMAGAVATAALSREARRADGTSSHDRDADGADAGPAPGAGEALARAAEALLDRLFVARR